MKKNLIHKYIMIVVAGIMLAAAFASCNKALPVANPLTFPKNGDTTIGGILNRDTSLSFYKAAVSKAGLTALFNDNTAVYTAFIPNNAAFIASGITSLAVVNSLPAATLAQIVYYSIIPGEQFIDTLNGTTTTFPNVQLPSGLTISSLPGTTIPINMPVFPSKRPTGFWVNNIPVVSSNLRVQNGIIHIMSRVVSPPSQVLAQLIAFDPNLTLFQAAINRADSGRSGLNSINYVLAYAVANLTVFAPTNAAFNAIGITTAAQINAMPLQTVQGIVAYHIMPYRAFSVNFPTTGAFFPTLLNGVVPSHPGVKVQATIVGGFGAALQITGVANGGLAANFAAPSNLDKNAVNGVEHVIDRVLLPQ